MRVPPEGSPERAHSQNGRPGEPAVKIVRLGRKEGQQLKVRPLRADQSPTHTKGAAARQTREAGQLAVKVAGRKLGEAEP